MDATHPFAGDSNQWNGTLDRLKVLACNGPLLKAHPAAIGPPPDGGPIEDVATGARLGPEG